jgi:autotransporter-associated beta strand protein
MSGPLPLARILVCAACCLAAAGPAWAQRQMETLGRGVVATRVGTNTAHVSWRLLGHEGGDTGFNLYRSRGGAAAVKVNAAPLVLTTDFRDVAAGFPESVAYHVRPVAGGAEGPASAAFVLPGEAPQRPFLPVPLERPPGGTTPSGEAFTFLVNDISAGDLDGDGEYEFVVRWDPSNAKDNAQGGYTGNVLLDAIALDGRRLWRIDLGRNIRAGAHYTQFIVYDLDGDGRAEVAVKTAPGTIDGTGRPVLLPGHSAAADYRNSSGYILAGPEYLSIFDGPTGAALATVPFQVRRHPDTENPSGSQLNAVWGDSYGNRVDRFLGGVAYLDGQRPSLIMARGYYTRTALAAWDWRGGALSLRWLFDTHGNPALDGYRGQGNHQLAVADVDGDGRDEIVYGSMTVDDNGRGLHTTRLGHGDALHVSDFDPDRPGLEVFMPHESPASNGGIGASFRDARNGAVLWSTPAGGDVGRGAMMDLDPRFPGAEGWAPNHENMFAASGAVVGPRGNAFYNFGVWWEGGPLRQLLDNTTISRWNWAAGGGRVNLLTAWQHGAAASNGTKATPALSADLFGDWREEVVWKNGDSTQLLVFTTAVPATLRLPTLMHDPTYRMAVAWQNVAYNQPPHPGFFLGHDMPAPPRAPLWTGQLVWRGEPASPLWAAGVPRFKSSPWAGDQVAFAAGDRVLFDLSGHAAAPIALQGVLEPAEVIVHNPEGHDYAFTGPGRLGGAARLVKSGPGRLTLGGVHEFTGRTTVNQGELRLAGELAGPATVQGLGRLSGSGRLGGGLAAENRAVIAPGGPPGEAAVLESGGPVVLAGATLEFDLAGSAGQPGDRITTTGDLTLAGLNRLVFRAPPGGPAPGTHILASYAGTLDGGLENLAYDPAFAGMETFLAAGSGALVLHVAAPPPADVLAWRGSGPDWDKSTANWLRDGRPALFADGDEVHFGSGGAAAPAVALHGLLVPAGLRVEAPGAYAFNGPGEIAGEGGLVKAGPGSLAVAAANSFSGGTWIHGGTVAIGHAGALGGGPVRLAGGTWATGALAPANPLEVLADSSVSGGHSGGAHAVRAISGPAGLRLTASATNVFDFEGSLAAFHGTLALTGSGSFRLFSASSNAGNATIDLGSRPLSTRSGSAFHIGALAGGPGAVLRGANGYTSQVTFTVGGNHRDSAFAGAIINGTDRVHLVKTGTATLTLSGTSTYAGTTRIEAGTLRLLGASLGQTSVNVEAGGRLAGHGALGGALACAGALAPDGLLALAGALACGPGSLVEISVGGSGGRIEVAGDLSLAGRIEVGGPRGLRTGVYPLIDYAGAAGFGALEVLSTNPDFTCQLDLATPGRVNAVVTSLLSDFEHWQILHFGGTDNPLAQAGEDPDGDGQLNQVEFRAGTDPRDPASRFAAALDAAADGSWLLVWPGVEGRTYEVLRAASPAGPWHLAATVVAGPGGHASHSLASETATAAFFVIRIPD